MVVEMTAVRLLQPYFGSTNHQLTSSDEAIAELSGTAAGFRPDRVLVKELPQMLQRAASQLVPPAHWGYLQSGVDGDVTRDANHAAYAKWKLVPRRFVDVSG